MKKIKTQPAPEYETLRRRSISDLEAADILMKENRYDQAIELCHFSLEKMMKAALIKYEGKPPRSGESGHNLLKIANTKTKSRKILLKAIKKNSIMLKCWERIEGKWSTDLRYEFMGLESGDFDDLYESYRGLCRWIRTELVE